MKDLKLAANQERHIKCPWMNIIWCSVFFKLFISDIFSCSKSSRHPGNRDVSTERTSAAEETHTDLWCVDDMITYTHTHVIVELVVHPWVSVCTILHAPRRLQWHVVMAFKRMMDEQSTTCPQKHTLSPTPARPHAHTHLKASFYRRLLHAGLHLLSQQELFVNRSAFILPNKVVLTQKITALGWSSKSSSCFPFFTFSRTHP